MPAQSCLPPDLILVVADALAEVHDAASLANFARASRAVNALVTPALYRAIFIENYAVAQNIHRTVTAWPHLGRLVRTLSFSCRQAVIWLAILLRACPYVVTLRSRTPDLRERAQRVRRLFVELDSRSPAASLLQISTLRDLQCLHIRQLHVAFPTYTQNALALLRRLAYFSATFDCADPPLLHSAMLPDIARCLLALPALRRARFILYNYRDRHTDLQSTAAVQGLCDVGDQRISVSVVHASVDVDDLDRLHIRGEVSLWDVGTTLSG